MLSLSQSAAVQINLFPEFAVVGDELALAFDSALADFHAFSPTLSLDQRTALAELDQYLTDLSGPHNDDFWCDRVSLAADSRWERVRSLARVVLGAFGWPDEVPARDAALYISSNTVTRNA